MSLIMVSYSYIVFAIVIYYSHSEECVLPRPSDGTLEKKLQTELLCNHDYTKPPNRNNSKSVEVALVYFLQMIKFDTDEEILTVYSWNVFIWDDDSLKWDLDKYQGIKTTLVNFYDIWNPRLKVKNDAVSETTDIFDDYYCAVDHTGQVKCIQFDIHDIVCSTAMKHWPYDTKHCILKIDDEAWSQRESNIIFIPVDLVFYHFISISGWKVLDTNKRNNLTGDYQASMEFRLGRLADGLEAAMVIPSIVISLLTTISLLLSVKDNVRLGIQGASLFSHYLYLSEVNEYIPKHSTETPVILLFICSSMALTLVVTILTLFLRRLYSYTSSPSSIITSINTSILNGYGRYFVFPRWNIDIVNKTVLDSLSQQTEWVDFSNIINSIFLFVCCITYIIIYSIYIPQKSGVGLKIPVGYD